MKKYTPVLLGFLVFACQMVVDIDVPFKSAQLTVNSIFNPDSVWSANVSLNHFILDSTFFKPVEDALVVIYREGFPVDTLMHQKKGNYRSDTGKPQVGIEYEIRASAANYETVYGKSTIPLPSPITNVEVTPGSNRSSHTVRLHFNDNPSEINYYQIVAFVEYDAYYPPRQEITTRLFPCNVNSNDKTVTDDNSFLDGLLVKDFLFNGKEADISFTANAPFYDGDMVIVLRSINDDCYKYKNTAQLQNKTKGDAFAQPVNVYNNIKNGFGIFGGYSQSTFIYHFPKPIITAISPLKGKPGDHVVISGENFSEGYLKFNGSPSLVSARIVKSSEKEIEVIIPDKAITGKIVFQQWGKVAISPIDFEIIE